MLRFNCKQATCAGLAHCIVSANDRPGVPAAVAVFPGHLCVRTGSWHCCRGSSCCSLLFLPICTVLSLAYFSSMHTIICFIFYSNQHGTIKDKSHHLTSTVLSFEATGSTMSPAQVALKCICDLQRLAGDFCGTCQTFEWGTRE
jgi:hypothetical protein